MFRLYRLLNLLKILRHHLREAHALTEGEARHIEHNIVKSLSDICQTLVPYNGVKIEAHAKLHKSREIIS